MANFDSDTYFFKESSKYICRRQGCYLRKDYVEGRDYEVYFKNNSDCIPCQKECEKDEKCGAVRCAQTKNDGKYPGDCVGWRTGKCLDDYEVFYDNHGYGSGYTCYKGNIRKVFIQFQMNEMVKPRKELNLCSVEIEYHTNRYSNLARNLQKLLQRRI